MSSDYSHILSKTTEVQSSVSKQQWILQQIGLFGTSLCYLLCYFTEDQCKGQEVSGAPGSQVQR